MALKGILPNNHNGRQMLRHWKVYAGDTHPHQAQVAANANEAEE